MGRRRGRETERRRDGEAERRRCLSALPSLLLFVFSSFYPSVSPSLRLSVPPSLRPSVSPSLHATGGALQARQEPEQCCDKECCLRRNCDARRLRSHKPSRRIPLLPPTLSCSRRHPGRVIGSTGLSLLRSILYQAQRMPLAFGASTSSVLLN